VIEAAASELDERTHRKVTRRLIPFLFLCYILAYLDRVNVGFARLQMQADLAFSDTAYGIGAGIFFIGYFFFEVPSNLLMRQIGARLWIARIMIAWGLVSAASMFVTSVTSFYVLRFLLGVAEAGFFPGIIWYLTQWYTRTRRAQIIALFMTAIAVSGVVGGPLSGWILDVMDGVSGMRGWRWLYLLEGLPSVVVGFVVLRYLDDGPGTATWLTAAERTLVQRRLAEDEAQKQADGATAHRVGDAFRSGRVWACCAIYFGAVMGIYGVTFWLPQIISETITRDPLTIGLVSAIPWGVSAVTMVLVGRHSDRTGERRWHIAIPAGVAAVFFVLSGLPALSGWAGVACLTVATAGVMAASSSFWVLPTAMLSGSAAAAGIAWINSVGNLSGYASPFLLGAIRDATRDAAHPNGNMLIALSVLAVSLFAAGAITLALPATKGSGLQAPGPGPAVSEF
jgi:MFS family permease